MYSERTTLDLVGIIYDCVDNEVLWPVFLERFAALLDAKIGTFYIHDTRTQRGASEIVRGMDPAYDRAYRSYYAPKNVYMTHGKSLLITGNVTTSEELCPDGEVLKSEFYNDWIRPQGLRSGINGVLFNQASLAGSIGAIRTSSAKPFSEMHKRFLRSLMPHLQRAVALKRRIAQLESLQQNTQEALDRWSTGVLVVDHVGHILLANETAAALLRRRDGLSTHRNILHAATPHDSVLLHRTIRETVEGKPTGAAGSVSLIRRPSGKAALQVMVSPSVRHDLFSCPQTAVLLFVHDPETREPAQAEILQRLYGLTAAEARIAMLTAVGKSVRDIADEVGVRENTVRIQLKKIFDKTGATRQAELVRLVLSGPGALRK